MLKKKATRSNVMWGFVFAILVTDLGFYGCGSGSSPAPDDSSPTSDSTSAAAAPISAAAPMTASSAVSVSAPPLIPVPIVPPSAAITGVAPASAGQVTISAPNTLATGDIVTISGSTNYDGTYTAINPTPPSFSIAAPFVGPLVPSGPTAPVVQQQIVATPVTGIARSTTPGQVTVVANNTLTNGTPIVIAGSSIASLNGPNTVIASTPASFSITTTYVPPPAGTSTALPAGATLGVVQTGGGVLPNCTTATTGTTGAITLPSMATVPSRFMGVAPLAVFFDATGTTATATTKPFHDLEYRWDFADVAGSPVSGTTWGNGSRPGISSRNTATGPVAAHVFEKPGTYTVNLTVTDGTNSVSNTCAQIAVTYPDVVFAGANTICFSKTGTFNLGATGECPTGAQTITDATGNFTTAINNNVATNKRLLFRRGEVWTASAFAQVNQSGPITIGSYGTGTAAITSTNLKGVIALFNSAVNDLRIMDLDVAGSGASDTGDCVVVGASPTNVTILRLGCHDIGGGIIMVTGANITGSVIQDNHIYNINAGVGIFGWAINSAYLGNFVGPFGTASGHNIRLQPGQKVAISNNTISTPGTSGEHNLTVRALEHTPDAIDPTVYSAPDTQYIYISDNKMIAGAGASIQMFQVGPASTTQNNWISDVIAERNWLVFGSLTQNGFFTESVRITVRNNICNASGGAAFRTCFDTTTGNSAGAPAPDANVYINNTCYSSDASASFDCVSLDGTFLPVSNTVVKNNLAYAPSGTTPHLLVTAGTVTGTIGASGTLGNSSNAQALGTNPNFLNGSGLFNTPLDFKLPPGGSYAIGGGVSVPVWSDFFRVAEPSPRDMGAVNH